MHCRHQRTRSNVTHGDDSLDADGAGARRPWL